MKTNRCLKIRNNLFIVPFLLLIMSSGISLHNKGTVDNTIKYGDKVYKVSKGLEQVFRLDDYHSSSRINITDGKFYKTQVTISGNLNWIWRTKNASVWLYATLFSPGNDGISSGTYNFMPRKTNEDNPALATTYFFKKGKLAIDLNKDGRIESDDGEYLKITDGTINLKKSGNDYIFDFNLTLENGKNVIGTFTGDFIQV